MFNARRFTVKNFARLTDIAPVSFDNCLMSEQMPIMGSLPRKRVRSSGIQPASLGTPGPGESISTGLLMVARRSIKVCAGIWLR